MGRRNNGLLEHWAVGIMDCRKNGMSPEPLPILDIYILSILPNLASPHSYCTLILDLMRNLYICNACIYIHSIYVIQKQETPLDLAVKENDTEAMTFLLSVGADVDLLDQVSVYVEYTSYLLSIDTCFRQLRSTGRDMRNEPFEMLRHSRCPPFLRASGTQNFHLYVLQSICPNHAVRPTVNPNVWRTICKSNALINFLGK